MPPVEAGAYLLTWLFEVGPVMAGGMGPVALTHLELRAWQENVGLVLQPWEVRCLARLSREYIAELHKAEKRTRPAPWQPDGEAPKASESGDSFRRSMRALAGV